MAALTPEKSAAIIKMYRDGEKVDVIHAVQDASISTICRIAKEAGLSRGKGRRPLIPKSPGGS
jgi:uncharacterized protein YerC